MIIGRLSMLKATNISKVYKTSRGEVTALAECSLEFAESGLVLICGESGGGKTTLLNILAGTDTPSSGEVECSYGKNYGAFVFQGGRLSDSLTVEENFALIEKLFPEKCVNFRAEAEKFGLAGLLKRKPAELSFGEVQRAAILRAAMANRPVLFADEPTANLDEENCRRVAELLKDISRKRLVIVSTHEREYFEDIADRIIVLKCGKVVSDTKKSAAESGVQSAERQPAAAPAFTAGAAASSGALNSSAPRLGAKTAFWLAGKTLRRTAVAVALTMVFLIVCLFSLFTCSNIFFAEDFMVTYSAIGAEGSQNYDLKRDYVEYGNTMLNAMINSGEYSPISDGQFEELGEEYGAIPFFDRSMTLRAPGADEYSREGIAVRRIYLSDTYFFPVVYGSADLGEGIAISLAAAEEYGRYFGASSAEEMLGVQAGGYTITCIYSAESAAYEGDKLGQEAKEDFLGRIIMPVETYKERFNEVQMIDVRLYTPGVNGDYSDLRFGAYSSVADDSYYFTPMYGEDGPKQGEIYVSQYYASEHGGVEEVLGTQITYNFVTADGGYIPYTFTVTGVFNTIWGWYCVFSDEDARQIALHSGMWRMDGVSGICLPEYDIDDVRALKELGYSQNSYLSENIDEAQDWFDTLIGILGIVCAVSAVCALAALAFYAVYAFAKCGREVGILRSYGLSPVRASAVFFCQLSVAILAALVLGAAAGLAAIPAWNAAAFSAAGAMTVYFAPLSLAVAAGAAVLAFGFGALFVYLSAVRKSAAKFLADG